MSKKSWFIGAGIVVIYCLMLKYMFHVVFPFMLAIVCFFTLKPIIDFFEKVFHIKRSAIGVSLLLVIYFLLILIFGTLLTYGIIYLLNIIEKMPYYYQESFIPVFNQMTLWLKEKVPFLMNVDNLSILHNLLEQSLIGIMSSLSNFITQIPGFLFSFFIFIISTFFLFLESDDIKNKMFSYCSNSFLVSFIKIKNQTMKAIRIYLKCQMILMILSFAILCFGFTILHMKHSLLYAFLTALLDSLPFIGVGIVLIPLCIICLFQNAYLQAFYIFLVYLIINVVRSLLEPQIMNKQMKIPSFILLFSMTLHLYFFGLIGVILSPIHMNLIYCLLDYYKQTY